MSIIGATSKESLLIEENSRLKKEVSDLKHDMRMINKRLNTRTRRVAALEDSLEDANGRLKSAALGDGRQPVKVKPNIMNAHWRPTKPRENG